MRNKRTKQFHKLFAQLPRQVQEQAVTTYQLFRANPHHPSLHFKRIDPQEPIYSVRVGRNYRAVGLWEGDTISWYWIGSHEDYNNL
ncbi:MAG: type II toxin-antitoxin system RelE family toxin [Ktedonobacteraceae bacterium]